jgi:hypothetical protein
MNPRYLILLHCSALIATSAIITSVAHSQTLAAPSIERIDPKTVKLGPVRHESLTPQQIERLRKLQIALAEVDDTPLAKWIDDFRYDAYPDREIAVFEAIAHAYQAFCAARQRTIAQKQDVFALLLDRSGTTNEDTLKNHKLKVLTLQEAKEALSYYRKPAAPILLRQR